MKDETILQLLNEAKDGIQTVSDFYAPEIMAYIWASIIMSLFIGLGLIVGGIVLGIITRSSQLNDGWAYESFGDTSIAGVLAYSFSGSAILFGAIIFVASMWDVVMMLVAPKIHITAILAKLLFQ